MIDQDYLDGFRGKLAGLLPANFTPQGSGPLKVLITYPADSESEIVKDYLRSSVNLPIGPRITEDFRHTPTESITVVLFRTAMGVTEVDEVRDVLRLWSMRRVTPSPPTSCGGDSGPATTSATWPPGRPTGWRYLHRLLCACGTGGPRHRIGGVTRANQRDSRRRRDHDAAPHPAR